MTRVVRRVLTGIIVHALVAPCTAAAQARGESAAQRPDSSWPAFDVTTQVGSLPIHFGEGDLSGVAGPLWSGRLAYRPPLRGSEGPRRMALELSAAQVAPGGWGTTDPGVTSFGVSLRESLRMAGPGHVDPFLSAGVSWLRVSPQELPPCGPPTCMREGGKSWREGRFTLVTLGGGVVMPLPAVLRGAGIRADGRLHLPLTGPDEAGASEGTWVELSAGLRVGF